jgi:uncharacterized protein
MPAAEPQRKRGRRFWIKIAVAVVLATAAAIDWSRAPERQVSVWLYERAVITPYRTFMRPSLSLFARCRYRPTCSRYSLEAVQAHGFARGIWMTTTRLFRCMPWVPAGTRDPVPPRRA